MPVVFYHSVYVIHGLGFCLYLLNKIWVFDQSERAQGPIYVIKSVIGYPPQSRAASENELIHAQNTRDPQSHVILPFLKFAGSGRNFRQENRGTLGRNDGMALNNVGSDLNYTVNPYNF